MASSKVDWGVLRGALGTFAMCLLVGAVVLGASYYFREEMAAEYRSHHARFRDVSRKYLAVDDEERIIEHAYPEFVRLYESGILGSERRLSWIEALSRTRDAIDLPSLDYQIDSQRIADIDFPINLGAFDIHASTMNLKAGLLHEGDLFGLFDGLDRAAEGIYTVSRCDISRAKLRDQLAPGEATLNAECRLNWFTVDLKGDRKLSL